MDRFTEDQIQQRELRAAAFHEAGHRSLYRRFGGDGEAMVWQDSNRKPDEKAWFGQFRNRVCPQRMHDANKSCGILVTDLPSNWEVLCGMAGLVVEELMLGENTNGENPDTELLADTLETQIQADEVSPTDLEAMRVVDIDDCELHFEDVEQTWRLLLEDWDRVQKEAERLIAQAQKQGYAAVW